MDERKFLDNGKIVAEYEYNKETNEVVVTITEWLSKEDDEILKQDIIKQLEKTNFIIKFK
jgi:hypothetical protein